MSARFRRHDVRTDDAARQPAPLLPCAPTPAAAPNDSPACPSPATDEFACRDNTLRIEAHADPRPVVVSFRATPL
jgi:hypothetical protein